MESLASLLELADDLFSELEEANLPFLAAEAYHLVEELTALIDLEGVKA